MMMRIAVAGATGRMGRAVLELAAGDDRFEIAAALTAPGAKEVGSTLHVGAGVVLIRDRLEAPCDILIDFTTPEGTMAWLDVCRAGAIPMVTGTTGLSDAQLQRIRDAGEAIPILHSANFSIGVGAILRILAQLARDLGPDYDVEIVETHHGHKVDAPSGTALILAEAIAGATGRSLADRASFGRRGAVGPRRAGEIGIHAVRMGEVVSEHDVHFAAHGEVITITHAAHSRVPYAAGALRAAQWLAGRPAGLYTLEHLLGH